MDFTEAEKAKIQAWVGERAPGLRCFCCGSQKWTLLPGAALPVRYNTTSGRIHYMDGFPLVGLMCDHCAHVEWFGPGPMGVKPEMAEPGQAPHEPGA